VQSARTEFSRIPVQSYRERGFFILQFLTRPSLWGQLFFWIVYSLFFGMFCVYHSSVDPCFVKFEIRMDKTTNKATSPPHTPQCPHTTPQL
jgi:hypothetical protein